MIARGVRCGVVLAVVLAVAGALGGVARAEYTAAVDCGGAATVMLLSATVTVQGTLTEQIEGGGGQVVPVPLAAGQTVVLPCAGEWLFAAPDADPGNYVVGTMPDGRGRAFWWAGAGMLMGSMFALMMVRAAGP